MFHKNLKYYRLKNNLTKAELAKRIGVTPMAITYYEKGERRPEMETIKALAKALGVKVADFLIVRDSHLVFQHNEFKKTSKLSKQQQEFIKEAIEEYFNRFFTTVELLGGDVLAASPVSHSLPYSGFCELDAFALRSFLKIPQSGPVGSLIKHLENQGILVYLLDYDVPDFSGVNGEVNGRPYIVINNHMDAEGIRTTIGHELVHFAFAWPSSMSEKEIEKKTTEIASTLFLSKDDALRELGVHRCNVTTDMQLVCKEYGISLRMLVQRVYLYGIINESTYKKYSMLEGKLDDAFICKESTTLFEQLVFRAVNEHEISIHKGAELLKQSYEQVAAYCRVVEV